MTTALDIITDAFNMLGVYGNGDTINLYDQALALQVLNDMFDSWSNDSLTAYCIKEVNFPLVVNQQTYTIGTSGGANINSTRPLYIIDSPGTCFIRDTNNNDFPVQVVTQDYWNQIGLKTNTSNIPSVLFYDPQFPLGNINLFPVPNVPYTCFFDAYLQMGNFATTGDSFSFPPGYKMASSSNLAVHLKPYYQDGQLDPLIIVKATQSLAAIKRTNSKPVEAEYDPEIVSRTTPTYNIYRDRSGS